MATTLATLDAAIRAKSPRFTPERIPRKLLATYLGDAQRDLLARAQVRSPTWGAQTATLAFALGLGENTADTAGPGGAGALPAGVTGATTSGTPNVAVAPAGLLAELDLERSQGDSPAPVVRAGPFVPSAVDNTARTMTVAGAAWSVDAFVGAIARVVAGPAAGQRRRVTHNTADTLTFDEAWGTAPAPTVALLPTEGEVPTTASEVVVIESVLETTGAASVVSALPAMQARVGYLVQLDATGVPVLDLARPIISTVDAPIPLPPLLQLLGGTVRYVEAATDAGVPLTVLPYGARFQPTRTPAITVRGESAFLCGDADDWCDVASIELHYVPVLGDFTAPTDYVLLPDAARTALTALGAAFCANHLQELGETIAVGDYAARADAAVATLLDTIGMQARGRTARFRAW